MKYTIDQFNKDFPDNDTCLYTIYANRYGEISICPKCDQETKYYKVRGRKCYECKECGHQIYPLAGTIFHKSSTSLKQWFYAIYLFSNAKNGVSAKELERHLGVTYKTAWRMAKQIRLLMAQDNSLSGKVEIDEAYIGGKPINRHQSKQNLSNDKQVLFGMIEREGKANIKHVVSSGSRSLIPEITKSINKGTLVYSDEQIAYRRLPKLGYKHESITHSIREYARGDVHTNNIEGFWSQLKRSINVTYHVVSSKYLPSYVNEFAFRYNHRQTLIYPILLHRAGKLV